MVDFKKAFYDARKFLTKLMHPKIKSLTDLKGIQTLDNQDLSELDIPAEYFDGSIPSQYGFKGFTENVIWSPHTITTNNPQQLLEKTKQTGTIGTTHNQGSTGKNIGIAITKYAVFGESDYFKTNAYSQTLEAWMYRMMLILAVSCVACLIYWFVKYKRDSKIKAYLVITILTIIVSYVVFQFQYPAFPSMNVRYIIPALVLQLCIVGASTEFFTKKKDNLNH